MISKLPIQAEIGPLLENYLDLLEALELTEVVGRDVLEEGLRDLAVGALPLAAELVALEAQGRCLAEAVNSDTAPHTAQVHGILKDLLTMEIPVEMVTWARRVAEIPPPDVRSLSHGLASLALRSGQPMSRALGRFVVFELLCLSQRVMLHVSGERLELVGGGSQDVEAIAEAELREVESRPALRESLFAQDDPLRMLEVFGLVRLADHAKNLKSELATASVEIRTWLDQREKVLDLEALLAPADAVILRNGTANLFEEEELTAEQLRRRHPGLLGHVSEESIWKRKERMIGKIRKGELRKVEGGPTLLDVTLRAHEGGDQ